MFGRNGTGYYKCFFPAPTALSYFFHPKHIIFRGLQFIHVTIFGLKLMAQKDFSLE